MNALESKLISENSERLSFSDVREIYRKQGYRFVGDHDHSVVKICQWTKESLRNSRVCYKELWYPPVKSHRCMMMTPYLGCNCQCLYCWRLHSGDHPRLRWKEYPLALKQFDDPSQIVEEAIEQRKRLLSGWKGNPNTDKRKFEEALQPTMMTMSLTGEPTFYPRTGELVEEARRRDMITFLVTNGTLPQALEKMVPLPYQLYVSISAPNKKLYTEIARPLLKDAWERQAETLAILPSLDTRKVLRLTMIKGLNITHHEEWAGIIQKAEPDFVEVKAYEWVGESQKRLPMNAMPYMEDIEAFAERISQITGRRIQGKFEPSGAVLLA